MGIQSVSTISPSHVTQKDRPVLSESVPRRVEDSEVAAAMSSKDVKRSEAQSRADSIAVTDNEGVSDGLATTFKVSA